jgi:hypothetical protein
VIYENARKPTGRHQRTLGILKQERVARGAIEPADARRRVEVRQQAGKIVRVLRTEFDGLAETDGDGHGEKFLGLIAAIFLGRIATTHNGAEKPAKAY